MKVALSIAKSNILEVLRDFKSHGIVFILPMVFILIFGFLFSKTSEKQVFKIAVTKTSDTLYRNTVDLLREIESDEGTSLFVFSEFDNEDLAKQTVQEAEADVAIVKGENLPFKIYINESRQQSAIVRSLIIEVLSPSENSLFETESVINSEQVSGFQLQAGGLIIYGILIIMPQIAGTIALLKDKGYIFRYKTSRARSVEVIAGFTMSSFLIGIVQSLLLFYVASWFGLQLDMSTVLAFIFIIPVIFFTIGMGLVIGTLAPKASTAQDIGTILSIVLGFLSGSFIVGIEIIGFNIGETFFSITSIIPTFYAYKGITQIIIFDKPISSVLVEFGVISACALLFFVLGAFVWEYKNREK